MFITFILNLLVSLVNFLFSFLPQVSILPFGLSDTLVSIYGYVHAMASIFPFIASAMSYMLLGISLETSYFVYKLVARVVNWIRGSG